MIHSQTGVTVLGAGATQANLVATALDIAPLLVCADGGAQTATRYGRRPDYIIGDMDSISPLDARQLIDPRRVLLIEEQDSTDFDKCIRSVEAPFIIAVGVTAPRIDHALATLNVLVRYPKQKIAILTDTDFCFLCPPKLSLKLPIGARLSLFPMRETHGSSSGLAWPIDGIDLSPSGQIGTSNLVESQPIELEFPEPAMMVVIPAKFAREALDAIISVDGWERNRSS